MTRHWLPALLIFCTLNCFGRDGADVRSCPTDDAPAQTRSLEEHGLRMTVEKCYRYVDRTGDYALYLSGTHDRKYPDESLSSAIAAQLFRKAPDGSLALQWVLRDHIDEGEAGVRFSPELCEFPDLAGDGAVTPIVVYRFMAFEPGSTMPQTDAFSGRMKIIFFHGTTKIAIHATSGTLDDERSTRATDSFFALPKTEQAYLAHKMQRLYEQDIFGFDDSDRFHPLKEKRR